MNKQNFTPAGILAIQSMLYKLPDHELLKEAKLMSGSLEAFMNKYFNFTLSQASYLSGFTEAASFTIGSQLAAVLAIRNAITMDETPEDDEEPKRPKEIRPKMSGATSFTNGPNPTLTGDLSAHISWELH